MTKPYVNLFDLAGNIVRFREDLVLLVPKLRKSPHLYSQCQVVIVVTPDFERVFIGGDDREFPQIAREADTLTIQAFAERFDLPELQLALSKRVGN